MFCIYCLRCWQRELVRQPQASLFGDLFIHSRHPNVWFRCDIVRRNLRLVSLRGQKINTFTPKSNPAVSKYLIIWLIFMILTLLFLCFLEEPLPVGCKNSHKRSLSTGDNLNQGDTPGTNSVAWTEVFSPMKVNYKKVMQRKLHLGDSLMTTYSVPWNEVSLQWSEQCKG